MEKFNYYGLPIKFGTLMQRNQNLQSCSLSQSIAQNIYLIVTSKFNENRYDESYGCELWDMDFEQITNESLWLERIRKSVMKSVTSHELRLSGIEVDVRIAQEEQMNLHTHVKSVKKKLSIKVVAKIKETGEHFPFETFIYLSPLSID